MPPVDSFNTQPPGFGPSLPLYPQVMQAVRTTSATVGVSFYGSSAPGGLVLYLSYVQQLDPTSLRPKDREPCLVLELNGNSVSPGYYTNARLAGQYNGLPVFEVNTSASASSDVKFVRVTGPANVSGFYPCVPTTYDPMSTVWSDGAVASILPANGELLSFGWRYLALNTGKDASGVSVYVTYCCGVDVCCEFASEYPDQLFLSTVNISGCECLSGTITLNYDVSNDYWTSGELTPGGGCTQDFYIFTLACLKTGANKGRMSLSITCQYTEIIPKDQSISAAVDCQPLPLDFGTLTTTSLSLHCCDPLAVGSSFTAIITE